MVIYGAISVNSYPFDGQKFPLVRFEKPLLSANSSGPTCCAPLWL